MRAWITGAGAIAPHGQGLDAIAAARAAGSAATGRVERVVGLDPIESRRMDRLSRMAVAAAREAVARADYPIQRNADRAAVLLGTMTGGVGPSLAFLRRALVPDGPPASPAVFTNAIRNGPAAHVALDLGLRGPGFTLDLAEASALAALRTAADLLEEGRSDAVLCGGAEEDLGELDGALTGRRDATVDGAVLLLLEPPALARARDARPLAGLLGAAAVSVPSLPWVPARDDRAAEQAIALALADAGIDRAAIDLELTPDRGGSCLLDALLALGRGDQVERVLVTAAGRGGHYEAAVVGRPGQES